MMVIAGACMVPGSKPQENNTLKVGMFVWAPFMTINPQGEFEGFDVDVAQELAKRMGKKLEIQDLGALSSCFIALEQNKIDLIMSDLDITEQRLQKLALVQYTGDKTTFFELVFWNEIPEGINNIEDLRAMPNITVCAEAGSAQEKFLDSITYVTKKPMSSAMDMLLDIKYGKSMAVILEPTIAARFKKQEPAFKTLQVSLPTSFQVYGCGIGIKKQQQKLIATVTNLVQDMKVDGILPALEKKWGLEG